MFETIAEKLASYLKIDKALIKMETNIKTDLNADSLTIVELLYDLEQEIGTTIPDEVVAELNTVGDLVNYLEKNNK